MTDHALSRRLSYLLRHAPHEAGLTLAPGGWVPLTPLLAHLNVTRAQVEAVVSGSDKQRFALRGDHIRANQGHSVPVDLQLEPATPPARLFHGTHAGALSAIREGGLRPMNRHHVHLSQRFSGVLRGSLSTPETSEARSRPQQRLEVELKGVLLALQWNW
ncbi:RNA 2'-phosphotransferase, partial [Deinococcus sp. ME38]|uniref:RNA 2'-phosphotransferase n=1 Tax=Deinococcus sp. ME38 TaxID=3400344 RepID=UPI003B5AD915